MFWETFVKLCNSKNTKPNPVAKLLGIPSGSLTDWKNGSIPRDTTLLKIAEYFNVSVNYLLGKEEKEKPSAAEATESMGENEKRLFAIWAQIPDHQKPELLNLIEAALRMNGEP